MNVTTSKAGVMWCPMVRTVDADNTASYNRINNGVGWFNGCINGHCMMWRWFDAPTRTVTDIPASETPNGEPVTHDEPRKDRKGYCGLAGRPAFVE